ncbi:hypothetical protein [Natrinema sp. 1APR25-10V2]|uniref:hypothetical protein n=1 Tax=Natrinema sp. 1APR25-10V2 TaxID=2951081 RepID=UPI002875BE35|nr:hypothetical protein [Natrinema sp. 1APR25-10V2]MDS0474043.1 hypothetical protein [Natrinema sp. 1APR25-10V2]
MADRIPLEKFTKKIDTEGISLIAIPEKKLTDGKMPLLYHTWGDTRPLKEDAAEVSRVSYQGKTYLAGDVGIGHTDVHFVRRIPVFSAGVLGTPEVPLKDGVENIRAFLTEEREPTPDSTETTPLESLLDELIEAGADPIGIDKQMSQWGDENRLMLRISLEPGIGVPIVEQYSDIVVDDQSYKIDCICDAVNGPAPFGRVTLYASDNIGGMEPVSIETGQEDLREFLRTELGHE